MTLDSESRALVQQLVDALAPLTNSIMAPKPDDLPDTSSMPWSMTRGNLKKADAAVAAAKAALAAAGT
ncbi:hypothetical protein P7D22_04725 [Lichenihabitans sp. Uapishka_5]|uniref:hypothetical protein n=1 Tax=Lichenihabitans sp. Uapishka_5 TaxID=3037302 RepID=UPI0029E81FA4|nr:hypothetical protein [Lichenihabitans sp. Uapishka_5]MDX7950483.1 hypothetical protein [Lichenihabitans sp. Uapishka_5]